MRRISNLKREVVLSFSEKRELRCRTLMRAERAALIDDREERALSIDERAERTPLNRTPL